MSKKMRISKKSADLVVLDFAYHLVRASKKKIVTLAKLSNRKVECVPSGRAVSPVHEVAGKEKM